MCTQLSLLELGTQCGPSNINHNNESSPDPFSNVTMTAMMMVADFPFYNDFILKKYMLLKNLLISSENVTNCACCWFE